MSAFGTHRHRRSARRSALAVFLLACGLSAAWALSAVPPLATSMHLLQPTRLAGPESMTMQPYAASRGNGQVAAGQVTFSLLGEPEAFITGSIPDDTTRILKVDPTGSTHEVQVILWRLGGDMAESGVARFNGLGLLPDLRVGAAAPIGEPDPATYFEGVATFRMAYQ